MASKIYGTGVALVTPFTNDKQIDFPALDRVLDHVTNGGVDYLVVCGTTAESATLRGEEKNSLLQHVKKQNSSSLPIIYGIGGNNTQQCLEIIEETDFEGVDGILSVSPYYNKPSQRGIIEHYRKIADKSPVPLTLYNVPGRTSSNLSWQTVVELSKHPNISGIKEASGDLEQCMRIFSNTSSDFSLISGDDLLTGAILSIGGTGVISVLANAFPASFRIITEAFKTNNPGNAYKELFKFLEINPLIYAEGNPVGIKEVLRQMDLCSGEVRLPLIEASEGLKTAISDQIRSF